MALLIIGGTGFIGRNLESYFRKRKCTVASLSLRSENWQSDLKSSNSNAIINLVGKAHDHKGTATEKDYHHVNVELAKKIFFAFLESSASLLVHISSLAAIEEFESNVPLEESDNCHPASWYGQSKREAEEWLLKQKLPKEKKLIIIRPPMVHGPGDKGNLNLLFNLISKGIPYPLASFNNKRSFISIDNFSFFIKKIIENQEMLNSGIYHISDDESLSTNDIIQIIRKVTGRNTPNLKLPKFLMKSIARAGDFLPIPLNSKRLKKMTCNLLVSNKKIKHCLKIDRLPTTAYEGIEYTIRSFQGGGIDYKGYK